MNIIKCMKKIKNSKRVLFTTPSHSGGVVIPAEIKNLLGLKAFKADLSEVDGLDNIREPKGCILSSQQKAAEIYGAKNTFYLVNGSSSGIVALMLSVLSDGDKVLIARNTHESVYNGLVLTGAAPVWFLPDWDEEFDVAKGVTLANVQAEFAKTPDIKALIITNPTYEGVCSEIEDIAKFCKEKGIIFIVDEAHGALFPFSESLPKSAIELGADACVHSLHKNAGALTGCALLHLGKNSLIDAELVQKNLNLINSTSPSWLLIASIEASIRFLASKKGKLELQNLLKNIEEFKTHVCHSGMTKRNEALAEIEPAMSGIYNHKFKFLKNDDPTKLFFKKTDLNGADLSYWLDKNDIEDELVTEKGVLCLCGIGTTKKKLKKLERVLLKIASKKSNKNCMGIPTQQQLSVPKAVLSPKEAHFKPFEIVKKENAVGRIIAENITPYPPCIPILIVGEVIEDSHLALLPDEVKVISSSQS